MGRMITPDEAKQLGTTEIIEKLATSLQGLDSSEARKRLDQLGPNQIAEKKQSFFLKVLRCFWGPIPWMIEVAAALSAVVRHWPDFVIIMVLLLFNALISLWEDHKAESALDALKNQLALKARVLRDGAWDELEARLLVPGDVVRLRLGDIVPADVRLLEGDFLSVDQAALTGESLPVSLEPGGVAYSGSSVKQGEMTAVVTATGADTFFGRTAGLVESAGSVSHFQKAVMTIGDYLIYLTLGLVAVLILVGLHRGQHWLTLVQFALILTVAAIPVAMPAVLSVTMAAGALSLSKMKAIVSRLEAIEEMAGMDILCTDKTGTLTRNELSLGEVLPVAAVAPQELILAASLASKAEDKDAIDLAVLAALENKESLKNFQQTKFTPFDPVGKRTEARLTDASGDHFSATKGAPQVIFSLAGLTGEELAQASGQVDELAAKGARTLGVARKEADGPWKYLGILSLTDPPREDSAATIDQAHKHGLTVKMVTGDNVAIGREISRKLGIGGNIQPADQLFGSCDVSKPLGHAEVRAIEEADGFAQVFPEHKYGIVKALQGEGHLVGMTGDGVNDAPALKQADVGIAVSGATDAARAAADLVLTLPGLSVIVTAVEEARRIFERMNSYAIYRITETIRIMIFVVLAMIVYKFYPITAIMIILLALLNDIPIMTIAYDNTYLSPTPVRWEMRRVFTVATVLGLIGVVETFGLLILAKTYLSLDAAQIQSFIFLKLAVAGHLTLFVARTRKFFLTRPFPAGSMLLSALLTKALATMVVAMGWFMAPISWTYIGLIWGYCFVWVFIEDAAKMLVYRSMRPETHFHRRFLRRVSRRVNAQGS